MANARCRRVVTHFRKKREKKRKEEERHEKDNAAAPERSRKGERRPLRVVPKPSFTAAYIRERERERETL